MDLYDFWENLEKTIFRGGCFVRNQIIFTHRKYKMSQPRKSLLNPVHPEIAAHIANRQKFGFTHPLDILQSQLANTAEMINIPDGDYYTAGPGTKSMTAEFLTGIQNDVIQLSNRVFQQMLFPKLIHLITQSPGSCGFGVGESASWELIATTEKKVIENGTENVFHIATFSLHSWWRETSDPVENKAEKEYCRLVILSNPGDGTAIARIEELAADLKTVISARESILDKYSDLDEWVKNNI